MGYPKASKARKEAGKRLAAQMRERRAQTPPAPTQPKRLTDLRQQGFWASILRQPPAADMRPAVASQPPAAPLLAPEKPKKLSKRQLLAVRREAARKMNEARRAARALAGAQTGADQLADLGDQIRAEPLRDGMWDTAAELPIAASGLPAEDPLAVEPDEEDEAAVEPSLKRLTEPPVAPQRVRGKRKPAWNYLRGEEAVLPGNIQLEPAPTTEELRAEARARDERIERELEERRNARGVDERIARIWVDDPAQMPPDVREAVQRAEAEHEAAEVARQAEFNAQYDAEQRERRIAAARTFDELYDLVSSPSTPPDNDDDYQEPTRKRRAPGQPAKPRARKVRDAPPPQPEHPGLVMPPDVTDEERENLRLLTLYLEQQKEGLVPPLEVYQIPENLAAMHRARENKHYAAIANPNRRERHAHVRALAQIEERLQEQREAAAARWIEAERERLATEIARLRAELAAVNFEERWIRAREAADAWHQERLDEWHRDMAEYERRHRPRTAAERAAPLLEYHKKRRQRAEARKAGAASRAKALQYMKIIIDWTHRVAGDRLREAVGEIHSQLYDAETRTINTHNRLPERGGIGDMTWRVDFSDLPERARAEIPNFEAMMTTINRSRVNKEKAKRGVRSAMFEQLAFYGRQLMRWVQNSNEYDELFLTGIWTAIFYQFESSPRVHLLTPSYLRTLGNSYAFDEDVLGGDRFASGSDSETLKWSTEHQLGLWLPSLNITVRQTRTDNFEPFVMPVPEAGDEMPALFEELNRSASMREGMPAQVQAAEGRVYNAWRRAMGREAILHGDHAHAAYPAVAPTLPPNTTILDFVRRLEALDRFEGGIGFNQAATEALANLYDGRKLKPGERRKWFHRKSKPGPKPKRRQGGKAPWVNAAPLLDLRRQQIDFAGGRQLSAEAVRDHCFVYAMRMSGLYAPELCEAVACRIYGVNFTLNSMKQLCVDLDLHVYLTIVTEGATNRVTINAGEPMLRLALYDEHYFLDEPCGVSPWVVEHYTEAAALGERPRWGWRYSVNKHGEFAYEPKSYKWTAQLVPAMHKAGLLTKIAGDDEEGMTRDFNHIKDFDATDLRYCENLCPPIAIDTQRERPHYFWFGDFETTTDGVQHVPYLFVAISQDDSRFIAKSYEATAETAREIWERKLTSLFYYADEQSPRNAQITFVFHNLNYDAAFLVPYIRTERAYDVVEINGKIIAFTLFHTGLQRSFTFRDSLALITAPLRAFGKMFQLDVEKEIFPYEFYSQANFTEHRATWPLVPVDAMASHYADPAELTAKVHALGLVDDRDRVDAHKYSVYYCVRDCEVLRAGFQKFREQLREVTGLDCAHYLTLPSIAYNYLIKEGVFEGCHNLTGQPLFFIRKCVNGGRVMLARNRKQDVSGDIADFDAVSLYPSAMVRLYTLKGLPRVIAGETLDELLAADGFFARVRIKRVPRALDFPLLAQTRPTGVKDYENQPGTFYLDDITLRSVMQFHGVAPEDIEVLGGYVYNSGRNYRIRVVMRCLFEQRNRLKRDGNPLEAVYKLLMNACYGKSIMKPILDKKMIVSEDAFWHVLRNHASATLSYRQIGDKYALSIAKDLVAAEGFPCFGVHILAMSKLIMSEVMVTAQDLEIPVYYTDTDSMHLPADALPRLEAEFRERYGRELVGKAMGQFHTDFPDDPVSGLPTRSVRFIGVGKKAYIDKLEDAQGNVSYHMRMKGIPGDVIRAHADEHYGGDPIALYRALHDGVPATFNLLHNRVSFQLNRDMTYTSRSQFTRTVNF